VLGPPQSGVQAYRVTQVTQDVYYSTVEFEHRPQFYNCKCKTLIESAQLIVNVRIRDNCGHMVD
jgi:hypothetical protein